MNTPASRLPRLFTVTEAAEHLRMCTKSVRRLIKAGKLPFHEVGNRHLIAEADVGAYIASTKK